MSTKQEIEKNQPRASRGRGKDLLVEIRAYLDAHLAERITLRDVAERFGVSISTVTQLFHHRTGTTLHKYLTQRRMEAAQQLIREGVALEEVGRMVGYRDHSTFYRAFFQTFHFSPREFRRQIKEE